METSTAKVDLKSLVNLFENDELELELLNKACVQLSSLDQQVVSDSPYDFLRALGALLYGRAGSPVISQNFDQFFGKDSLTASFFHDSASGIQVLAVKCVRNACIKSNNGCKYLSEDHQRQCLELLLTALQQESLARWKNSLDYHRILFAAFSGISYLLKAGLRPSKLFLPSLLGAFKMHMSVGLPGHNPSLPHVLNLSGFLLSQPILNSTTISATPVIPSLKKHKKGKPCKQKRLAKRQASDSDDFPSCSTSSENEATETLSKNFVESISLRPAWSKSTFKSNGAVVCYDSESESESESKNKSGLSAEKLGYVRQMIVETLELLIRACDRSDSQSFWLSFFPDPEPSYFGPRLSPAMSVCQMLLKESVPKVRSAILSMTNYWAHNCKLFLSSADNSRQRSSAFTSFSQVIAGSITDLHKTLQLALVAENQPMIIAHILKTCSVLISVSPYKRLKSELFPNLVMAVRVYVKNRDANVCVAAFGCITSCLLCSADKDIINQSLLFSIDGVPWLWQMCLNNIIEQPNVKPRPIPVRLEALQTAVSMLKSAPQISGCISESVLNLSPSLCQTDDHDLQLHCARLVKAMVLSAPNDDVTENIWHRVLQLDEPFSFALKNVSKDLDKNSLLIYLEWCQLVSSLPENVFLSLSSEVQKVLPERLVNLSHFGGHTRLQCSALNALANIAVFPFFKDPLSFYVGLFDELSSMNRTAIERLLRALGVLLDKRPNSVLLDCDRWLTLFHIAYDRLKDDTSKITRFHSYKLIQLLIENQALVSIPEDTITVVCDAVSTLANTETESKMKSHSYLLMVTVFIVFPSELLCSIEKCGLSLTEMVESWSEMSLIGVNENRLKDVVTLSKALTNVLNFTTRFDLTLVSKVMDILCDVQRSLAQVTTTTDNEFRLLISETEVQRALNAWTNLL